MVIVAARAGFIEAISMKLADILLHLMREMLIFLSSSGCRVPQIAFLLNSGSSSRNKNSVVRQADFSRLWGASAAYEGYLRNGVVRRAKQSARNERRILDRFPATECILVVSKLSFNVRAGSMDGKHLAIMDLPLPAHRSPMAL